MQLSRREWIQQTARTAAGLSLGWLATIPGHAADASVERQARPSAAGDRGSSSDTPAGTLDLPDAEIVSAYAKAATQNVLAAVDPRVFFGYWSVCADREGFGRGNTYPSLDGHQMSDALLWLGQVDVVKANWDYVRSFQKPNGRLPLAILPGAKEVYGQPVEPNGGFYTHWVPGDPLRALGSTTYIQNADVIFRFTQDQGWLRAHLPSVNLAGEFLASLTRSEGLVKGGGYYVEMPARLEFDGVAQCHAAEAFRRLAALNRVAGDTRLARRYASLAVRITKCFRRRFWAGDHFAECIHPERGVIDQHGLTDTNWAALATAVADRSQEALLWPQLRQEPGFRYGGIPTAIATRPETYEDWEFSLPKAFSGPNRRHDLAAMGRVWHLEAWARARNGDGDGIVETLRQVCQVGRGNGYYWRERYHPPDGRGAGPNTYCEYPANLIRIVHRFLLGVEFGLDGSVAIAPTVPAHYWEAGFGQTLAWRDRKLAFHFEPGAMRGSYTGTGPQRIGARLEGRNTDVRAVVGKTSVRPLRQNGLILIDLLPSPEPCAFEVRQKGRG
jgi:hypothetical protein